VAIGISASVGLFSALVLKASAHLFTTDAEAAALESSGKQWENKQSQLQYPLVNKHRP
jgi:hypothetical protein